MGGARDWVTHRRAPDKGRSATEVVPGGMPGAARGVATSSRHGAAKERCKLCLAAISSAWMFAFSSPQRQQRREPCHPLA